MRPDMCGVLDSDRTKRLNHCVQLPVALGLLAGQTGLISEWWF